MTFPAANPTALPSVTVDVATVPWAVVATVSIVVVPAFTVSAPSEPLPTPTPAPLSTQVAALDIDEIGSFSAGNVAHAAKTPTTAAAAKRRAFVFIEDPQCTLFSRYPRAR